MLYATDTGVEGLFYAQMAWSECYWAVKNCIQGCLVSCVWSLALCIQIARSVPIYLNEVPPKTYSWCRCRTELPLMDNIQLACVHSVKHMHNTPHLAKLANCICGSHAGSEISNAGIIRDDAELGSKCRNSGWIACKSQPCHTTSWQLQQVPGGMQ